MSAEEFMEKLINMKFENTFNPYSDHCEIYDGFDSPQKRSELIKNILKKACEVEIDSIWVGRDLGHRGGRRTGLALTDDIHFSDYIKKWDVKFDRPTIGQEVSERTATVIWSVLSKITKPVFLWNVFPLHPYEEGKPFSNRAHNSKERVAGEELLSLLVKILNPKRVVAIGNDAAKVVSRIVDNSDVVKVRHPSYGGESQFLSQVKSTYKLI